MAYIKFKKEDEPSIKKNYIPNSIKYKKYKRIWQVVSIIEGLALIYLLYYKY